MTSDEPFAWQSKEFLRHLAIGKPCVFRVDYSLDIAGGKDFGSVFVNDRENVSLLIVEAGWAKVREGGAQQSPFYDQLLDAQKTAMASKRGLHNDDPDEIRCSVRAAVTEEDPSEVLCTCGKGGSVDAIVDGVISGSLLRVTLLETKRPQTVMLAGIQCPSMGKKKSSDQEINEGPEPFAREAKHLAEMLCLDRDVVLIVDGVSQHGALIASVKIPKKHAETVEYEDLAMHLISKGMARCVEWSLNMMTAGSFNLREAERSSRCAKRGVWHNYVPQPGNASKLESEFSGKVVEVVSGDCLVIMDRVNGTERRVMLSSIRAPRVSGRERTSEPWGPEAKEFLRQRLIGKNVTVKMEYSKTIPGGQVSAGAPKPEDKVVDFGTVQIMEKGIEGEKMNNIAELLLMRGLASTARHRVDDERSAFFEDLLKAEELGKRNKKGIHSNKDAPITRINDLSAPGSAPKARQHLPFLQRAGKVTGICEFVLSGSRLKIYVPKQSISIAFSPSGVRCPGKGEAFSNDALCFTRARFLQRNVEIIVDNVDKIGTFLGSITVDDGGSKLDLGVALLEFGLAQLHPMTNIPALDNGRALQEAEERAKVRKIGLWSKEPEAKQEQPRERTKQFSRDKISVLITEMMDANNFYVQYCGEARAQWIADQIRDLSPGSGDHHRIFKIGDLCLAKFEADNQWYRAKVSKICSSVPTRREYEVFFIDFGNRSIVSDQLIQPIPEGLAAVPPQAHLATLAFIHVPIDLRDDVGIEAMRTMARISNNGAEALHGFREMISNQDTGEEIAHLSLFSKDADENDKESSINAEMVHDGLARVVKSWNNVGADALDFIQVLEDQEKTAKQYHYGIWEYGDVSDDDDDDDYPKLK